MCEGPFEPLIHTWWWGRYVWDGFQNTLWQGVRRQAEGGREDSEQNKRNQPRRYSWRTENLGILEFLCLRLEAITNGVFSRSFLSVKMISHRRKAANPQLTKQMGAFLEINHHTLVYSMGVGCEFAFLSHRILEKCVQETRINQISNLLPLPWFAVKYQWFYSHGYAPSMQIPTHYERWITS